MPTYDELQAKHFAAMMGALPQYMQRLSWTREQVRAERESRMRDLIRAAQQKSAWHHERLRNVDPDRLQQEDLAALPVMTKTDLMANYDAILTDNRLSLDTVERHLAGLEDDAYLLDEFHAIASGGSSGQRGVFVYGWDAWMTAIMPQRRALVRYALAHSLPQPLTTATIAPARCTHLSAAQVRTFSPPGGRDVHRYPVSQPLGVTVAALNELQPYQLGGYPSTMRLLAAEARAGRLRISPKMVSTSGEPMLPEIREELQDVWGAQVFDFYACSEMGWMAAACGEGDSIHLADDLVWLEPVDAAGNPVPFGTRAAKVYATNLYNTTLPLIRYELTDEVALLDEPCACGSPFLRLAAPQGRLDDSFMYPGGVQIHPIAFRSPLGPNRHVVEYQVRQTEQGADIAVVVNGSFDTEVLRREVVASLERAGLRQPAVTLSVQQSLERTGVGKLKRFVPLPASL